jgi:methylphosphotriester-DNA--protein-cysteine methyltransferase
MNKLFISCILFLFLTSTAFAQTVYITKSGSKYHTSSCSYLSSSKISIDLSEAKSRGFTACSRSKPDSKVDANVKNEKKTETTIEVKEQKTTTSNQCEAITKKGTRCKRKAQTGSRYCWQHQK